MREMGSRRTNKERRLERNQKRREKTAETERGEKEKKIGTGK